MNKREPYILETCVDSTESALIAVKAGANRLELCSNLIIGGTTPSPFLFEEVRRYCDTKIHVLIRPRFGDFCYTDHECSIMAKEIAMFHKLGAEGVVIGVLTPDGRLNKEKMNPLLEAAEGMKVVLHRAFDMCRDPFEALEDAKEMGITSILTSGQKKTAVEGKELLAALMKQSEGKIEILIGGGICAETIQTLALETGNTSYHMSGKTTIESRMQFRRNEVSMGISSFNEYEIWQADEEKIKQAVKVLQNSID